MIALPDDFLLEYTARNIAWLKKHPQFIDHIFYTSTRESAGKIRRFLTSNTVHVTLGYPRDQTALPAFCICMAPESEIPLGVGDERGTFTTLYLGEPLDPKADDTELTWEEQYVRGYGQQMLARYLENTGMRASYRIECWADNADMVSCMYAIAKWSLWAMRMDMHRLHWTNVTLSGMDLEPMSEYMPCFVYRRALTVSMEYENIYYTDVGALGKYGDMIENPHKYQDDPNIPPNPDDPDAPPRDPDRPYDPDLPRIEGEDSWILCPKYYSEKLSGYSI